MPPPPAVPPPCDGTGAMSLQRRELLESVSDGRHSAPPRHQPRNRVRRLFETTRDLDGMENAPDNGLLEARRACGCCSGEPIRSSAENARAYVALFGARVAKDARLGRGLRFGSVRTNGDRRSMDLSTERGGRECAERRRPDRDAVVDGVREPRLRLQASSRLLLRHWPGLVHFHDQPKGTSRAVLSSIYRDGPRCGAGPGPGALRSPRSSAAHGLLRRVVLHPGNCHQ